MNAGRFMVLAVAATVLCGCATPNRYDWGTYEPSLYVFYKNPATARRLSQSLQTTISSAENSKQVVAPGIYAEYGYLLLKEGKSQDAVQYFRDEENHWPESKMFMDQLIKAAAISDERTKGN